MYDRDLFRIVKREELHVGDVVCVAYCFGENISNKENKILIIDSKLNAVWYEEEPYSAKPYLLLPHQIITRIIGKDNPKEYIKSHMEDEVLNNLEDVI